MADEGKPPAGRGGGAGRGGQRKSKFAPTVPSQRRRRPDEAGPSSGAATTAAEAAAANEAFQDLIRAAQTESKWMRGRGRGFGRGRGGAATQVMFGGDGNDMRRTAVAPQPRAAPRPKGEGKGGVKEEGGSSSSRRRLKPNIKPDSKGQAAADADGGYDEAYGSDDGSDVDQDLASLFDYEQYFPTTLPLPLHHPCDDEADAFADAAVMRRGLPEELALKEDDPEGATAQQLGLTDLSIASDTLYLFQLPSLLPLGLPDARKARTAAAAAAGSSSSSQAGPLRAAAARELPSGPVGKLLVFKSGRVKLQMGSCLLDVTAGMPCVSRQDVVAINKSTGHLIQLGPVTQRAVVCPDIWQLISNQEVPEFRRNLQQQQQREQEREGEAAAAAANGADGMDVDGEEEEDDLEDGDGVERMVGVRVRVKKQQVLDSEEGSEEDGSNGQQQQQQDGVKAEQQQQQQRRTAQQLGSSSEEEQDGQQQAADDAATQQEPAAAAAAVAAPKQQQHQQPSQPAGNGALGWLELPAAPTARGVAGRGGGKFRPSTRSPSPAAAAIPSGAAGSFSSVAGSSVKQEDAMDVDS